jgi:LysM repeat protein
MMSRKIFIQVSVLVLLLLAFLAIPASAQAGGACGGKYIVDAGDTLSSLAVRCGTSVSAITTANPGVADPLRSGQTLTLPGSSNSGSGITVSIVSSDTKNYNPYIPPTATVTYSNRTYIVQYGDTFSAIASRYGVSINQLWAANPQVWNINYVYAGQAIYIPTTSGGTVYTPISQLEPLSYGNVPAGAPYGAVRLVNKSGGDIYVSIQGSTRDGIRVIYEYPVSGTMKANVPAGWYVYVAWVNGQKLEGQFDLGKDSEHTLTFYNNKTVVE